MAVATLSNPRAEGLEGVRFLATLDAASQEFIASREALEDLAYDMLETPEALLAAFGSHQETVAAAAGKALAEGGGKSPELLASLL
jgi:hypothetical protein